jgi:hypothetical protein
MTPAVLVSRLARGLRGLPWWAWLAGLLATGLAAGLALRPAGKRPAAAAPPAEDPRLTFATPFLNVRPGVRYVGDGRCAGCHAQGVSYPQHPMGRSFAPAAAVADQDLYAPAFHNVFERSGFLFRAARSGGRIVHAARRRTADGQELYAVAKEPAFAVGSGTHGRGFLVEEDGRLYQSPVTWFPQARRWDLSPGYAATTLFDRPVKPGCLFCHADAAEPVAHTINRYHTPLRPRAIGCERCHGPAELHLRDRDAGLPLTGPDRTIVNPARLSPALRDAVCEQCHLQGEARVLRRGRGAFDFRPGLPLHLFWSVFVVPPDRAEGLKFVGHAEQMRASACAGGSAGRLGCTSCHDPHRLPDAARRVAYYRDRCQQCHERKPCVRPADDPRRHDHRENNCVGCHMPRRENADVRHTTVTDHRVPRRPGGAGRPPAPPRPGEIPLVHFHRDLEGAGGPEASRDLGLAVIDTAQQQRLPGWARAAVGRLAQPLLDEAVDRAADDVAAREGRGLAFAMQGSARRALDDFRAVLALAPGREVSLAAAADMAAALRQDEAAERYGRQALAVNPFSARSHARLAETLARRGRWPAALQECRAALRLSPAGDVRRLLVSCLLRTGDRPAAEAEFRTLLADRPAEAGSLNEFWADQVR